jgi:xanthine/uracil permease
MDETETPEIAVEAAPEAVSEPVVDAPAAIVAAPVEPLRETTTIIAHPPVRNYPSLYDTKATTIVAVLLGVLIVGGIQMIVQRIYMRAKSEHELLTRFVVTVVALVIGAYITDLLIAGPDTSLLSDEEHTIILSFIKDICLMVFAFYFGTRASSTNVVHQDPTE